MFKKIVIITFIITNIYFAKGQELVEGNYCTKLKNQKSILDVVQTCLKILPNNTFEETMHTDISIISFGTYIVKNNELILTYDDSEFDNRVFKIIKITDTFIVLKLEKNGKKRKVVLYKN